MVNFGPLTAEIGSGVWGTPTNFNGFSVLHDEMNKRNRPYTMHRRYHRQRGYVQLPAITFGVQRSTMGK